MTVPIIDGVDHSTFEYRPVYQWTSRFRGIFEWGMLYKENDIPEQESKQHAHRSEPYRWVPSHTERPPVRRVGRPVVQVLSVAHHKSWSCWRRAPLRYKR